MGKISWLPWRLILLVMALTIYAAVEAKKGGRRVAIVKCCGRKSCSKTFGTQIKVTNTTSAKNTMERKTESSTSPETAPAEAETDPPNETPLPSEEITTVEIPINEIATSEQTTESPTTGTTSAVDQLLSSGLPVLPATSDSTGTSNSETTALTATSSITNTISTTLSKVTINNVTPTAPKMMPSTTTETTTTKITTTTKPPTNEELVLGKCETTFEKDTTLLNNDGTVKDPDKYGFWVQSCGQQFLFGKSLATWRDNFIRCYAIGMEPISFEDATKRDCFLSLVSKWKYSSNYWTSGLRVNRSDFSWCTKKGSLTVERTKISWVVGQPQNFNNSENCLHLNVSRTNGNFSFSDRMCTEPQIFACQGPTTPAPTCSSPLCPNVTCAKNTLFYTNMGKSQYLTNPNLHGSWFTYNGRSYLFSSTNKTTSYLGAMQACCEVGMTLLSLEFDYKYKSVVQAIKENASLSDYFWTSGSDRGCESKFGYCTAKRILRQEAVWAPGQPDNAGGNENSVAVFIDSAKAQLFDYNEDSKLRYICEARDTSGSNSGGTAVRDECVAIYNVSQAEIDSILNPNIIKDTRLKCFIKCLGENAGLMVNGKFVENDVLATLEKMSVGNWTELQKSMQVMDECGQSTYGMDECDKAAQMIKCSSEKAPEVLNGIIMTMDQSMPIEKPAMPPPAFCYDTKNCNVNPLYVNEVTSCTGNCTVTKGYVRTVCGKKYLVYNGQGTFLQAFTYCCSHGMDLASIETAAEIQCLAGISNIFSEKTHANTVVTVACESISERSSMRPSTIILLVILFMVVEMAADRYKVKLARSKNNKIALRAAIIKCCGQNSCINSKKKGNNGTAAILNKQTTKASSGANVEDQQPADQDEGSNAQSDQETTTVASDGGAEVANPGQVSDSATQGNPETSSQADPVSVSSENNSGTGSVAPEQPVSSSSATSASSSSTTVASNLGNDQQASSSSVATTSTTFLQTSTTTATVFVMSLINQDNSVKDSQKYGYWEEACGHQFLFGKSLVNFIALYFAIYLANFKGTWRENVMMCGKIGMEPISLESREKLECFNKSLISRWKYGSYYWTSGFKLSGKEFSWCLKNGSVAIQQQVERLNDPNSNCVVTNISRGNASVFTLSSASCNASYFLACQGRPTVAPNCSSPTCPNITCAKNPFFYVTNVTTYLKDPRVHGTWFSYRGRKFLFSQLKIKKTFTGAMTACCEIGMSLLSLEYDFKYDSIKAAIKDGSVSKADIFWTSGSDSGCEGAFGYCTAKRILRQEAIWAPTQPDNAGGRENAVAVFVNGTNIALSDFSEDTEFRYICEARDTPNAESGGAAIREECSTVYDVTQKEIDNLLNNTDKLDLRLKCFLRCVGENAGLMVNGKFVDNDVIAVLEKMAGGNLDELKKNIAVKDDCQNAANGMDECDKAAQLIKCTKDKAPDVLTGVIMSLDKSIPLEKLENFPTATCPKMSCTINATLQQSFQSAAPSSTLVDGDVRSNCGYKFFHVRRDLTLQGAYDICCQYGLKLVSIDYVEMVQCLYDVYYASPRMTWVAGSGFDSPDNPRWCTSTRPFSTAGFAFVTPPKDTSSFAYGIKMTEKSLAVLNTAVEIANFALCV
ncbi:uncharacterized protein LOC132204589 isoform X2 [Neocloeon triangulifer]|uniref:uncharacterized protein LOC132204589 isoform X2 n=1 Tax=Neocloeon triangulifer TaxID=2078957 RepID=UPI00286F3EF6|nr:uncharacterized protein LOC132204589 isoform X2 [Neocloeon triangulifer]